MTCDMVLLIYISHFVISCNVKDIFIPKGKNSGHNIGRKKIRLPYNVKLPKKLGDMAGMCHYSRKSYNRNQTLKSDITFNTLP